jgi:hypothetical protein
MINLDSLDINLRDNSILDTGASKLVESIAKLTNLNSLDINL